jgi:hypothetical protein
LSNLHVRVDVARLARPRLAHEVAAFESADCEKLT